MIRGIAGSDIFYDDVDRDRFVERARKVFVEEKTACYAFALLSNHVHFLLRTGQTSMAGVMRRLLTGYAVSFNKRHKRSGHLFQNRYKSILCEEDPTCFNLSGTFISILFAPAWLRTSALILTPTPVIVS